MRLNNVSSKLKSGFLNWIVLSGIGFSCTFLGAETLFKMNGKTYSTDNVSSKSKQGLFDVQKRAYDATVAVIDTELLEAYIDSLASKQKKAREKVEEELFAVKEPTDAEIKAWYDKNKARINYPFEQIKNEIPRVLKSEKQRDIRDQILAKAKKETGFQLLLSEPLAPVMKIDTTGFPASGNLKSNVTIVEFADYQCPHCKHAYEIMKKLKKSHGNKFKLVYMDFPINRSGISRVVSEGSFCAKQQNKFWEYHELAFANQSSLSKDSPKKFAEDLKLNVKNFEVCLSGKEAKDYVAKSEAQAKAIGVQGTPAIFINGRKVAGLSEEVILKAIDSAGKSS